MKKYFIRETGMMYNDDYYDAFKGFGGVADSFDTLEEATAALKRINLKSLLKLSPLQYEEFYRGGENVLQTFEEYMLENFGVSVFATSHDGSSVPDRHFEMPKDLTEDQAWEIREMTGCPKINIYEMQGEESPFWGFKLGVGMKNEGGWYTCQGFKFNEDSTMAHAKVPIFFLTKDEAYKHLQEMSILHWFSPIGIIGTYEELSDTPQILKSLVEQDERIEYHEDSKRLNLSQLWDREKLYTVNSLLKNKFIEIAPIPIEEVEAIGGGWDPEM